LSEPSPLVGDEFRHPWNGAVVSSRNVFWRSPEWTNWLEFKSGQMPFYVNWNNLKTAGFRFSFTPSHPEVPERSAGLEGRV